MKTYPECFTCIARQAVSAITNNENDPERQIEIIQEVLRVLAEADHYLSPSEIAGETNRVMRESLGVEDLHQAEKQAGHDQAIKIINKLRELATQGEDPLEQWLKISAAGNVIDIIHSGEYDLWEEVQTTVSQELHTDDLEVFRQSLYTAPHLLYMADNVGETVFDRVMIENLDIPVIYAVKSGPVLNDATYADAVKAGIDQIAEVVETGSWSPGTILSQSTESFRDLFENSPLILSKGQANYETLDGEGEKVFFLLRSKCPVLSERLNVPIGNLVLQRGSPLN